MSQDPLPSDPSLEKLIRRISTLKDQIRETEDDLISIKGSLVELESELQRAISRVESMQADAGLKDVRESTPRSEKPKKLSDWSRSKHRIATGGTS